MCDASNSVEIVDELLKYTTIADFSIREELVLKIAILAERFAPNVRWYVDASMDLIERAGEHVSEDIWHRVIQLVTNNDDMKEYAANKVIEALKRGGAFEALISVGAFVLGEYGAALRQQHPPLEIFQLLQERFPASSGRTKGLLMTSYLKLAMMDPNNEELKQGVMQVFEYYSKVVDAELQQRAVEYLAFIRQPPAVTSQYIQPMPKWEGRESSLVRRLAAQEGEVTDARDDEEAGSFGEKPHAMADLSVPLALSGDVNGTSDFVDIGEAPAPVTTSNGTGNPVVASIDALDDLIASPTQPPADPPAAPDPFAASGNEHSLMGGPPPAITLAGDLQQWFDALVIKNKGLLYEDTYLQVSLADILGFRSPTVICLGGIAQ